MTRWKASVIAVLAVQCLIWDHCLSQAAVEKLKVIPSTEDCNNVCVASGDPHINTFDCVRYEYHGKCNYTLVKDCGGDLPSFEITGEFHRLSYHKQLSVIKKLLISCQETDIELDSDYNVRIAGAVMTNASQAVSCGSVQRYSNAVVIKLDIGLTVYWCSPFRAMVFIEDSAADQLFGNLCGLCGNNNNIKNDDFKTKDGQLVSDVLVFGESWKTTPECLSL